MVSQHVFRKSIRHTRTQFKFYPKLGRLGSPYNKKKINFCPSVCGRVTLTTFLYSFLLKRILMCVVSSIDAAYLSVSIKKIHSLARSKKDRIEMCNILTWEIISDLVLIGKRLVSYQHANQYSGINNKLISLECKKWQKILWFLSLLLWYLCRCILYYNVLPHTDMRQVFKFRKTHSIVVVSVCGTTGSLPSCYTNITQNSICCAWQLGCWIIKYIYFVPYNRENIKINGVCAHVLIEF